MAAPPSRTRRRADRVKADVSVTQLLFDFGYLVRPEAGDREQQFPCNLHGDGQDNKPSARVYPDNTWYCFGCDKMRDTIETVREIKGLGFIEAIQWLEEKYNLAPLPWEAGDYTPREKSQGEQIREHLDPDKTFEDDKIILATLLEAVTGDRDLSMEEVTAFWEGLDKLVYLVGQELIPEVRARAAILGIKTRIMEALRGDHD